MTAEKVVLATGEVSAPKPTTVFIAVSSTEGSGRVSLWRESNTDGYRGASRHPHVRRSASTSSKLDTGGSELPEWAADEVGSELGVFDASGAFQTVSTDDVTTRDHQIVF